MMSRWVGVLAVALLPVVVLLGLQHHALSSDANWPSSVPVQPGWNSEEIQKALGPPSASRILEGFEPPLMTLLEYKNRGLTLLVHRHSGLCDIELEAPWRGDVFGIPLGEHVDAVKLRKKTKIHGYFDYALVEHPGWSVYGELTDEPTRRGRIWKLGYHDKSRYGEWRLVPRP